METRVTPFDDRGAVSDPWQITGDDRAKKFERINQMNPHPIDRQVWSRQCFLRKSMIVSLVFDMLSSRLLSEHQPTKFSTSLRYLSSSLSLLAKIMKKKSIIGGRRSVIGGRRSVIGGRRSVVGGRRSVIGGRRLLTRPRSTGAASASTRVSRPIMPASYHFWALLVCVILRLATSRKYCKWHSDRLSLDMHAHYLTQKITQQVHRGRCGPAPLPCKKKNMSGLEPRGFYFAWQV